MNGMDLRTLQEILGHATLDMVMRYAHLADDHKAKALEIVVAKMRRKVSRKQARGDTWATKVAQIRGPKATPKYRKSL